MHPENEQTIQRILERMFPLPEYKVAKHHMNDGAYNYVEWRVRRGAELYRLLGWLEGKFMSSRAAEDWEADIADQLQYGSPSYHEDMGR